MCLFSRQLLGIYITDSQQAIEYGVTRLFCVCGPYILCGLMDVTTGSLRGMGASITPMLISVLGVCGIRLAWIYTIFQIPAFHTPPVLYLSYTVSWRMTFVAQLTAFFVVYRSHVKRIAAVRLPLQ
jgi:Na+-driven multidrug efflux pump